MAPVHLGKRGAHVKYKVNINLMLVTALLNLVALLIHSALRGAFAPDAATTFTAAGELR